MLIIDLLVEAKVTTKPPCTTDEVVWFQHQSPTKIKTIKPQYYDRLKDIRPDYPVDDREDEEKPIHKLTHTSLNKSFTYATITGMHKFGPPSSYSGFTYYFKLTPPQINKCVFDIVGGDLMKPTSGVPGLKKAMRLWVKHKKQLKQTTDKDIGTIYPRIEVIIPFDVKPTLVFPQMEDR
jgi:hypothetical protein